MRKFLSPLVGLLTINYALAQMPEVTQNTIALEDLVGEYPRERISRIPQPQTELHGFLHSDHLEFYGPGKLITQAVKGIAAHVGDIKDENSLGQDFQIGGCVYNAEEIVGWLNTKPTLNHTQRRFISDLKEAGYITPHWWHGFEATEKFKLPLLIASSEQNFRHERLHVIWRSNRRLQTYMLRLFEEKTQGMNNEAKINYVHSTINVLKGIELKRSYWSDLYDKRGMEQVVHEFFAHEQESGTGLRVPK